MQSYHAERSRTGSVRRLPSGRYEVRVSHGYTIDGKQRTIREVCDTEAEAEARRYELAMQMQKDCHVSANITLRKVWELYRADRFQRLAGTTRDTYTWQMESVILPVLGDCDVSKILHSDIQRLLSAQTRGVAQKTRTTLSSVLSWAVKRGILAENVMRRANFELPRVEQQEGFDVDPFAAIEGSRDVWGVSTVLECFERIAGLPLEPAWLACVGAGLRVEEALALRRMDVRRVMIGGRLVTQVAVHAATTKVESRKGTKTARSVRIVSFLEPFGARYWELVEKIGEPSQEVCCVSAANQNKRWRSYFAEPREYHKRMAESRKVQGRLYGLPYIPLSRMRATHETMMQEAGVLDSLNAAMHGHSETVSRKHYMRGSSEAAIEQTERYFTLVS